jgi:hypothetical protein
MNDFMNPKSMITPGAAGGAMMLIANSLCNFFPEFAFRYVALGLSFMIGALVVVAASMHVLERSIYWIVNSLVIFSMGVGASKIAANVTTQRAQDQEASVSSPVLSFFVSPASAQNSQTPGMDKTFQSATRTMPDDAARQRALEIRIKELEASNERLRSIAASPALSGQVSSAEANKFFRRW